MSPRSINFLHLAVSESPEKPFLAVAHPDVMGENNTRTALKGCGVKIVFDHETLMKVKF